VPSPRLRLRLLAAAAFVIGLLTIGISAPAFAHDELLGAEPADGAVLETLPAELTLTFSGVLLPGEGATEFAVTDSAGTDLTAGEPVLDGVRVTQPLTGSASGTISVAWRVVSSDGHPISGEYSFVVGEAGATSPASPAPGSPADDAAELLPLWIGVGAIVAVGLVVIVLVSRRRPSRED